jgi:hypothetical protein
MMVSNPAEDDSFLRDQVEDERYRQSPRLLREDDSYTECRKLLVEDDNNDNNTEDSTEAARVKTAITLRTSGYPGNMVITLRT